MCLIFASILMIQPIARTETTLCNSDIEVGANGSTTWGSTPTTNGNNLKHNAQTLMFFRHLKTKPEPDKLNNGYEWLSQFQRCSNNSGSHYQITSNQCTTQQPTRTQTNNSRGHKMKNPPPEYVAKSDTLVAEVKPSFMGKCQFELSTWCAEYCAYFHLKIHQPGVVFDVATATKPDFKRRPR